MNSKNVGLVVVAAITMLMAPNANANGRFPATVSVQTQPGNDQLIWVGGTWGSFVSTDDGENFQWICEQAIGYGGTFDPKYRIASTGAIFATTFEGLRRSTDGGCSWQTVEGPLAGHWVDWVELDTNDAVWVATSSGGMSNDVFRSTDGGDVFVSRNMEHPTAWWKTVRIAPSNPNRVYVSGYLVAQSSPDGGMSEPTTLIYTSDDGGDTWLELDTSDFVLSATLPQILFEGVLPSNESVVYARSLGANAPIGDALFRSVDAGQTWTRIFDSDDAIVSFLIRDDEALIAGTVNSGVFISTNGGDTWTPAQQQPEMACISQRSDGELFACGANWGPDFFSIGRSGDGQTWSNILRFSEIKAPLSCPAGTIQRDTCEAKLWPSMCEMFGCNAADAGPGAGDGGNANNDGGVGNGGGGGCCDSGEGVEHSLPLVLLVVYFVVRRRRAGRLA